MQDKTSSHTPIPTELNIAPRGKSWLHGQLIDGEHGHPTRQSMESAESAQPIKAPTAVAVPDAVRDAEKLLRAEAARLDRIYGAGKWYGFSAEKASHLEHLRVADTLAATPAAAPVELPDCVLNEDDFDVLENTHGFTGDFEEMARIVESMTLDKVRALLATATGLPAQAVPAFCHVASLKLKSLQERGYQITGYAIEKPVEGAQPERGFINHGGFVGWWRDGQSPLVQPGALDALTPAARDVLAERARQISAEGWTPEHDDEHDEGEMCFAAAGYAAVASDHMQAIVRGMDERLTMEDAVPTPSTYLRPWPAAWEFKPCTPRRALVKAGALIQAEIERIDRAAIAAAKEGAQQA